MKQNIKLRWCFDSNLSCCAQFRVVNLIVSMCRQLAPFNCESFHIIPFTVYCDWIPCEQVHRKSCNASNIHRNRMKTFPFFLFCLVVMLRTQNRILPHNKLTKIPLPNWHLLSERHTAAAAATSSFSLPYGAPCALCVCVSHVARRTITSSTASIILSCILCSVCVRMSSVFFVHNIFDFLSSVAIFMSTTN